MKLECTAEETKELMQFLIIIGRITALMPTNNIAVPDNAEQISAAVSQLFDNFKKE